MGTNGKIYKRGRVYWFEAADGKRTSLRTRDRVEAQRLAALRARPVSAFSAPVPATQPTLGPLPATDIGGADFTADVGAEQSSTPERPAGTENRSSLDGELVSGAEFSPEQEAQAEQLAQLIVLVSSLTCGIAIRMFGGISREPDPAARAALAGAWTPQCRRWIADETISPWTLILGATLALGASQFAGMAPVEKPEPTASPGTVGAGGV